MDRSTPQSSTSRRDILHLGAKGASLLAFAGVLGGLGGCGGSQKRRSRSSNQIGQPIPADPQFSVAPPLEHAPTHSNPVASSQLTSLPSFVIARKAWTRGKTKVQIADPMRKITRITVHHDAISPLPSGRYEDSVRRLVAIRNGHLGNHWADIGYHYAIDPAGRVWQARPLIYQGAHVKNHNPSNLGIVLFGNYEKVVPTSKAVTSLNKLIAHEMQRFNIPVSRVYTHRELRPTACPGRNLQARMNTLRGPHSEWAKISSKALNA